MFGEGKRDKKFLYALSELPKFKFYTKRWFFTFGNAHGQSATDILELCKKEKTGEENLVLCFIDLDDLKNDYGKDWKRKQKELNRDAAVEKIKIIWQINNAEEEYKNVLGREYENKGKSEINKAAIENTPKFINSEFWKRILEPIINFEKRNRK